MKTANTYPGACVRALLFISLFFVACSKDDDDNGVEPPPQYTMEELYDHSIKDAMVDDSTESIDTLWAIAASNANLQWKTINGKNYVLMATFMRYPSSYPTGDSITNTWGDSWLFFPAQMQRRLLPELKPGADTIQRICQLLGLAPRNPRSNTNIAQLWVDPEDLFRPAGNPDITTTTTGSVLVSGVTPAYAAWFDNNIIYSYYRPLQSATDYYVPWTRLGYTYDWAPEAKEVGLSEYVVRANSGMWVDTVTTASGFFHN